MTIDSVRNYCAHHFPVQQTARATYREMLEGRAKENGVDFVKGVATALTPVAFYEVVMNEAFRRLVDGGAEVSIDSGLRAAEKLQSLLDGRSEGPDVAEMMVELNRIIKAVKSTVPQEMWGEIVRQLDHGEPHPGSLDVETEALDEADEVFDPGEFADIDDEL